MLFFKLFFLLICNFPHGMLLHNNITACLEKKYASPFAKSMQLAFTQYPHIPSQKKLTYRQKRFLSLLSPNIRLLSNNLTEAETKKYLIQDYKNIIKQCKSNDIVKSLIFLKCIQLVQNSCVDFLIHNIKNLKNDSTRSAIIKKTVNLVIMIRTFKVKVDNKKESSIKIFEKINKIKYFIMHAIINKKYTHDPSFLPLLINIYNNIREMSYREKLPLDLQKSFFFPQGPTTPQEDKKITDSVESIRTRCYKEIPSTIWDIIINHLSIEQSLPHAQEICSENITFHQKKALHYNDLVLYKSSIKFILSLRLINKSFAKLIKYDPNLLISFKEIVIDNTSYESFILNKSYYRIHINDSTPIKLSPLGTFIINAPNEYIATLKAFYSIKPKSNNPLNLVWTFSIAFCKGSILKKLVNILSLDVRDNEEYCNYHYSDGCGERINLIEWLKNIKNKDSLTIRFPSIRFFDNYSLDTFFYMFFKGQVLTDYKRKNPQSYWTPTTFYVEPFIIYTNKTFTINPFIYLNLDGLHTRLNEIISSPAIDVLFIKYRRKSPTLTQQHHEFIKKIIDKQKPKLTEAEINNQIAKLNKQDSDASDNFDHIKKKFTGSEREKALQENCANRDRIYFEKKSLKHQLYYYKIYALLDKKIS